MEFRVVQWGTGNVGAHAIAGIDANPHLELVGLWVSSKEKVGKDAGELAGMGRSLGITATNNVDALLALKPDCIVYAAASDNRPAEAAADYERFLKAGVNVVATGPVMLIMPPESGLGATLDKVAKEAGKSLWVNGLDPGFANDTLPMVLTGLCRRIDKVHCTEIFNYGTYDQPATLRSMGFGQPKDFTPQITVPGVLSRTFGGTVRQIAAGLGLTLDSITDSAERAYATKDFETVVPIKAGTGAGVRFKICGNKCGREVIVIEHVTRMHDDVAPEWPQPVGHGCYRVAVEGDPSFMLDLRMSDGRGDHVNAACLATGMKIINAVPAVVEARPGHLSIYDLPLLTGRGLVR
jgi:hypothetical protein